MIRTEEVLVVAIAKLVEHSELGGLGRGRGGPTKCLATVGHGLLGLIGGVDIEGERLCLVGGCRGRC